MGVWPVIFAALMYFGLALLAYKAAWNLLVPYVCYRRHAKDPSGKSDSVCLEITIDIIFLCWTLCFLFFTDEAYLVFSKTYMILICFFLPIGSFLGLYIYGLYMKRSLKE
jgi:hypothetical protein